MHDGKRSDIFTHNPVDHREGKAATHIASVRGVEDRTEFGVILKNPEDAFHLLKEIETQFRGLGFVEPSGLNEFGEGGWVKD